MARADDDIGGELALRCPHRPPVDADGGLTQEDAAAVGLEPSLGLVAVPTLALAGDRDLLVSAEGLREMGRRLPRARTACLPRCGANPR